MRAPDGGNVWIQGVGTERVDLAEQINMAARASLAIRDDADEQAMRFRHTRLLRRFTFRQRHFATC